MPIDARHPKEIRADIRAGRARPPSPPGSAPGYVQANLAVLPKEQAYDFLLFCQRNPRPCPLIEVTDVGLPGAGRGGARRRPPHRPAALPHLQGRRARRRGDRRHGPSGATTWSRSCSAARSPSSGRCSTRASRCATSSRARTWRCGRRRSQCRPAGQFHGPMVVSMRPIPTGMLSKAVTASARFPRRARRAGAHRRSGRARHRGRRTSRTGATRWACARARCRCSGRAGSPRRRWRSPRSPRS